MTVLVKSAISAIWELKNKCPPKISKNYEKGCPEYNKVLVVNPLKGSLDATSRRQLGPSEPRLLRLLDLLRNLKVNKQSSWAQLHQSA